MTPFKITCPYDFKGWIIRHLATPEGALSHDISCIFETWLHSGLDRGELLTLFFFMIMIYKCISGIVFRQHIHIIPIISLALVPKDAKRWCYTGRKLPFYIHVSSFSDIFEMYLKDCPSSRFAHLIVKEQHRFQRSRSTTANLLEFTNFVSEC